MTFGATWELVAQEENVPEKNLVKVLNVKVRKDSPI